MYGEHILHLLVLKSTSKVFDSKKYAEEFFSRLKETQNNLQGLDSITISWSPLKSSWFPQDNIGCQILQQVVLHSQSRAASCCGKHFQLNAKEI